MRTAEGQSLMQADRESEIQALEAIRQQIVEVIPALTEGWRGPMLRSARALALEVDAPALEEVNS